MLYYQYNNDYSTIWYIIHLFVLEFLKYFWLVLRIISLVFFYNFDSDYLIKVFIIYFCDIFWLIYLQLIVYAIPSIYIFISLINLVYNYRDFMLIWYLGTYLCMFFKA